MWYNSKKDILEHLGKNGRNTKYVDRMIEKGVIIEVGWQYAMRWSKEWEEWQKFKEIDLVKKEEELKDREEWYHAMYEKFKGRIAELEEENRILKEKIDADEDKVNLEYYKKGYERMEEDMRRYQWSFPWEVWRRLRQHWVKVPEDQYDAFCEEMGNLF